MASQDDIAVALLLSPVDPRAHILFGIGEALVP